VIAVVQRVSRADVSVAGVSIGAIGQGLLVLVCAEPADTEALADKLVAKLLRLRIFGDDAGKMNLSVVAAPPELGRRLYERVVATARASHVDVACGEFGADMQVSLVNDGPVTIPIYMRS
jgi:D-tyrosyl-tRNA(Tyr) deacylase